MVIIISIFLICKYILLIYIILYLQKDDNLFLFVRFCFLEENGNKICPPSNCPWNESGIPAGKIPYHLSIINLYDITLPPAFNRQI